MTKTAQKKNDAVEEFTGTVKSLKLAKGFGFIRLPNDNEIYFHCYDLVEPLSFDEQLMELSVRFRIQKTTRGPRATHIRPLG